MIVQIKTRGLLKNGKKSDSKTADQQGDKKQT